MSPMTPEQHAEPMNLRIFEADGRWFIRGFGVGASGSTPEEAMRELARTLNSDGGYSWPVAALRQPLPMGDETRDVEQCEGDCGEPFCSAVGKPPALGDETAATSAGPPVVAVPLEMAEDLLAFLDNQQDIDNEGGPNRAMRLHAALEALVP